MPKNSLFFLLHSPPAGIKWVCAHESLRCILHALFASFAHLRVTFLLQQSTKTKTNALSSSQKRLRCMLWLIKLLLLFLLLILHCCARFQPKIKRLCQLLFCCWAMKRHSVWTGFFFGLIVVFVYCLCLAVPVLSPVSLPRSLLICAVLLIIPLLIFSFLLCFYLFFARCLPLSILIVAYNLITCNWNAK